MRLLRCFLMFGVVGVAGFVVDTIVLYALRDVMGLYAGRVLSFLAAAFTTWVLNRSFTFRDRRSGTSRRSEFAIYLILMLGGGAVNYGVYAAMITRYEYVGVHPVIGIAVGSLAGMTINLLSSRFLVFRFASDRGRTADEGGCVQESSADKALGGREAVFTRGHEGNL